MGWNDHCGMDGNNESNKANNEISVDCEALGIAEGWLDVTISKEQVKLLSFEISQVISNAEKKVREEIV